MTAPADRVQEPRGSLARDVLACLSLANLCYLNVWLELTSTGLDYFRKAPPSGVNIAAAAINVCVVALVFFALLTISRRIRSPLLRRAGQVLFVLFLVVPLNVARKSVTELSVLTNLADALGPWGARALFGVAALVVAAVTFLRTAAVTRLAVAALLMLSPLLPVFLAQALWTQWRREPAAAAPTPAAASPARGGPRIVWLLFDEWDQRASFENRPARIALPEIDRLRREGFLASRTVGGGRSVPHAIPSLMTGARVVAERDGGANDVLLQMADSPEFVPWSRQPTIFSALKAQGWSTAVGGWYVPYCRVLAAQIDACEWEAGASIYDRAEYSERLPLGRTVRLVAERQLSRLPLLSRRARARERARQRALQAAEYEGVLASARRLLTTADFVFLHWPIPHPFGIYDPATGRVGAHAESNYFDNLLLTDRTIGEVRQILESLGVWNEATVILTSDHSLRTGEWRVSGAWTDEEEQVTGNRRSPYIPLLVKLPHSTAGRAYDQPVSMLVMHDLVLALARGEIRTNEDLASWLDQNRGRFPLPPGLDSAQP